MCFVTGLVDGDAAEVQTGGGVELSVARGAVTLTGSLKSSHKTSTPEFLYNIFP